MACQVRSIIRKLLKLPDVKLSVLDSEDHDDIWVDKSRKIKLIIEHLFACDEGVLQVFKGEKSAGKIYVIDKEVNDYSTKLESFEDIKEILNAEV